MDFATGEPPPESTGNSAVMPCINKDEEDDILLTQAYDEFLTRTENLNNIILPTLEEDTTKNDQTIVPERPFTEENTDLVKELNSEINLMDDLINLSDLLEPAPSLIKDNFEVFNILDEEFQSPPPSAKKRCGRDTPDLMLSNDLSEASTNASIIVMDIFNQAFEKTTSQVMRKFVEDIFTRAWKTIKPMSRWRAPDPGSWKANVVKKRRADGLPYITKNKCRSPKIPKPVDCSRCQFQCTTKFSDKDRMLLCRNYWGEEYSGKKNLLLSLIEVRPIKTTLVNRTRTKTRSNSKRYFFLLGDIRTQVCQNFFCKTFCISPSVVREAVNNRDGFGIYASKRDPRGRKTPPNKTPPEMVQRVRDHINSFPTMQSHYVRKDIRRKYLDCKLSIPKIYKLYVDECEKNECSPVSESIYRKIFCTEFNLGFFVPKKDQCLLCTKYERMTSECKVQIEQEYQEHIARKETSNAEKKKDKERAEEEKNFLSATFDLQAILQIPNDEVGLLYYCRKLTVYNFTIYENALPNEAYCFPWSEVNGKKGSAEIGSILYYYLSQSVPEHVNEVAFFSDTCGGQNRNQFVAALLLWAVNKIDNLKVIEHKFLESGHSYMEVDSMHSSIESAKKHTAIYSMAEWLNVFRRARSSSSRKIKGSQVRKPYNVKEMKYNDFFDLKDLAANILPKNMKNVDGHKVTWLKIKRMKYVKGEMKIFYNYDMSNKFFTVDLAPESKNKEVSHNVAPTHHYRTRYCKKAVEIPTTSEVVQTGETSDFSLPGQLKQLYKAPLTISEAKKKDLLTLCQKGVIPEEYYAWFRNLKTDNNEVDYLPDATASDITVSSDED